MSNPSTLDEKLEHAVGVTRDALEMYDNPAVLWTGGKDSTLLLWLVREVCQEDGRELPPVVFLDHGQHFDAVWSFIERWQEEWGLTLHVARNDDVVRNADEPGDEIPVDALDEANVDEIRNVLELDDDTVPFLLNTYAGNHLLKTVPMNQAIASNGFDAVFSGIRWDEQEARADEDAFSSRSDPEHTRIHPILPFTETDVWDATWEVIVPSVVEGYTSGHRPENIDDLPSNITVEDIPVSPKYFAGYRSLGSEVGTERQTDVPAWKQDLSTDERAGRAQDKEDLMERLRDLGYM